MIEFVLIANSQGKLRLSHRTGTHLERREREILELESVRKCLGRGKGDKVFPSSFLGMGQCSCADDSFTESNRASAQSSFIDVNDGKLVYSRYGRIIVVVGISSDHNELAALEFIHLFIETLDKYFDKVTEMHILFHLDKVTLILQEMISGGNLEETGIKRILAPMYSFDKLEAK